MSAPSGVNPSPMEGMKVGDASLGPKERSGLSSKSEIGSSSSHEGSTEKGQAKSQLFEICAAKKWKSPSFECCKEDGPPHMRMFIFKVVVEIEEASGRKTLLECFSDPHSKKKAAAEHAAEGAVWYLKSAGHCPKNLCN